MNVAEQIGDPELQANTAYSLNGFEDIVAACAAVREVYGEDHPLLLPSDTTYGTSLWDKIQAADVDEPELFFTKEAQEIILNALATVADENSGSILQKKAALMLAPPDDISTNDFNSLSIASTKPELPDHKPSSVAQRRAPQRSRKLRIGRQLALSSFAQVVAAKRAVEEFEGKESVLLKRGRTGIGRHNSLVHAVDSIRLMDCQQAPEPYVFYGRKARIVRQALLKAAARDETIYDASAALILKDQEQAPTPARSFRERSPSERRIRSAGSLAMQR